jgi:hypothetical protein
MNRRFDAYAQALAHYYQRRGRRATSSDGAALTGRGGPMSARHRAEDADRASLMELLDPDPQRPSTVLVELSFATPRGDRRLTVRRLSDLEQSS